MIFLNYVSHRMLLHTYIYMQIMLKSTKSSIKILSVRFTGHYEHCYDLV